MDDGDLEDDTTRANAILADVEMQAKSKQLADLANPDIRFGRYVRRFLFIMIHHHVYNDLGLNDGVSLV